MDEHMTIVIDDVVARETRHLLQTYKRNPVTLVRGQGARLFDSNGKEYYDLLSGIGVTSLGHSHPALARADRGPGADTHPHVELVLSPATRTAGRTIS